MCDKPLVSIVIPVYNGANYMRQAIDSALAQTYSNIEVLVINDGSDDNGKTADIAKSYGTRIRYFEQKNGGVASALNLGIENMRGEYFSWLSHDDFFSPEKIEYDVTELQQHGNAFITFCDTISVNAGGTIIREKHYNRVHLKTPFDILSVGVPDFCSLLIHRSCFDTVGLFNENNKTMQDVEMILKLSKNYRFYHSPKSRVFKRDHDTQGTKTMSSLHKKESRNMALFLHKYFVLTDFFPDFYEQTAQAKARSYEWLGDRYRGFGAFDLADQCYKKAYYLAKGIHSYALKYLLSATIVNKLIAGIKLIVRRGT